MFPTPLCFRAVFPVLMTAVLGGFQPDPGSAGFGNLFPNGDVEDEWVNLITDIGGYATRIQADHTGIPLLWRLAEGAEVTTQEAFQGTRCIRLRANEKKVSAALSSDYWKVRDSSMPFGLPLLPGREVSVSFVYRSDPSLKENAFSVTVRLGTIRGLPSATRTVSLPPSANWTQTELKLNPDELLWGAEVVFSLDPSASTGMSVWVDEVRLVQDLDDTGNWIRNPSFESLLPAGEWPRGWDEPTEDQWISWIGDRFRPPVPDLSNSVSGKISMRCTVTHAEVSGFSQEVLLNQSSPRPIVVTLWAKLDNSIGNRRPNYPGPDNLPNLILYVYHSDGSMQEVSPTFCLGESDHDWDYFRCGFQPRKPVERVVVQVTVVGSEPTTSLWVDDFRLIELDDGREQPSSGLRKVLGATWGKESLSQTENRVSAACDARNLHLFLPDLSGTTETLVYLNADRFHRFIDPRRFHYEVLRVDSQGTVEFGHAGEKIGHVAVGSFRAAAECGVEVSHASHGTILSIPWEILRLDGVPDRPLGFNIEWKRPAGTGFWSGKSPATADLGLLILPRPRGVTLRSLRFGDRYHYETDQSQDFVSHPDFYHGRNTAAVRLENSGPDVTVRLQAGPADRPMPEESVSIPAGETVSVAVPYKTGETETVEFGVRVGSDGAELWESFFPLKVPPPVEIVLDQEFYYPEETEGRVEIHSRIRPRPDPCRAVLRVRDRVSDQVILSVSTGIDWSTPVVDFPLKGFRVNDLPVQDYELQLSLVSEPNGSVGSATAVFGRIRHTKRRPLPPIRTVDIDLDGRILINGDFRFFPIVPSVNLMEWDEAIELGANIYRAYYNRRNRETDFLDEVNRAWKKGVYVLSIGPGPEMIADFREEATPILSHPGFLACYGKQFYYWHLSDELIEYRKRLERIVRESPSSRLVIWGHHDASLLYDWNLPPWPRENPPVGYCYVKIMGRPGSAWRNAPFLTLLEQILDPHRFNLAEVNYYVAFHDDEVVPEHFTTYYSLRADDWRGMRKESYLSVIYGADGLYHWICTQKGGVQRLRGWFQELNFMWPIFAADDAGIPIRVTPADSGIEACLKRWEGNYYLLTANSTGKERKARIRLEGVEGMAVRKLFDLPGRMRVEDGSLADSWSRNDAFVYEIRLEPDP